MISPETILAWQLALEGMPAWLAAGLAHTRRPYEERAARYATAADRLMTGGLCDDLRTLADVGAGCTELDYLLPAGPPSFPQH